MISTTSQNSVTFHAPSSQNTAPVHEYRCLYTHDLKRKAKRWQDGLLRFHTFNHRVMVFDLARNFIGDTYVPSGSNLEEGDDLELEKDFAIVQVSEALGSTNTDLTELMQSRARKAKPSSPVTRIPINIQPAAPVQKHRSLNALLKPSHAQLGKASVPTISPFEERQRTAAASTQHPTKRRRVEDPEQSSRTGRSAACITHSTGRSKAVDINESAPILRTDATTPQRHVIDLCSDDVEITPGIVCATTPNALVTPRRNELVTTTVARVPDPTPDDAHVNDEQRRKPLRVISNAPRKMLFCQKQKKSKRADTAQIVDDATEDQHQGSADEPDLPPHVKRVRDRIAKIKRRQQRSADAGCIRPQQIPEAASADEAATLSNIQNVITDHHEVDGAKNNTANQPAPLPAAAPLKPIAQIPQVKVHNAANNKSTKPAQTLSTARTAGQNGPLDQGPWSREALDLFDWWPPDRDKEGHKISVNAPTAT